MDENNLDEQNLRTENVMPIEPEAEAPEISETLEAPEDSEALGVPEKPKKKRTGLFAAAGSSILILIVIITSVIMTTMMQKNNNGSGNSDGGDDNDSSTIVIDDDEEVLSIDDLSAGTVKTTIGGRSVSYKAKYVVDGVTAVVKSGTYESTNDDEVVFLVINGGTLSLEDGVVINKSGSEKFDGRGDAYSFYGTNSAVVVAGEDSQLGIVNTTINTSVNGANAMVATNGGSVVFADITINTTKNASRGLHATYGGIIIGNGGTISTQGQSCASLATDRGEGTVKVSGMELSTAGAGSPLIYSTGEIEVSSSTGTATGAQIAVIEGKNSIVLNDCDFSANGNGNRGSVDNAAVMIYQSMSGDASVGVGSFTAKGSKLTVLSDSSAYETTPFFFITNTTAIINLDDVKADFYEDGYFVLAAGTEEWGRSGSNGGIATITATNLKATNTNIGVDGISKVTGL